MTRRRIVEVADTYASAKATREVFQGHKSKKIKRHPFGWPQFVKYLGRTNSENYYSDKSLSGGDWEFYKHIAEGPQFLFVNTEITNLVNDHGQQVEVRDTRRYKRNLSRGRVPQFFTAVPYEITGKMPADLADLATNKGVQWIDPSGRYFEARIPHSYLAAGKHPETHETILVIYSTEGMHFIITGPKLDITADGIVG